MSAGESALRSALRDEIRRAPAQLGPVGAFDAPVFVLDAASSLARHYGDLFRHRGLQTLAEVGSAAGGGSGTAGADSRTWSIERFAREAAGFRGALALDFSDTAEQAQLFGALCERHGIRRVDFVQALDEAQLLAVYQPPATMRQVTLDRIDEFLALEQCLDDDLSRETLYALLLLRITMDRRWLQPVLLGGREEYFTSGTGEATFRLRDDELFCDAGAYSGAVLARFVGAAGGKYRAIHAFEPDRANFARLAQLRALEWHDIHLHNAALADCSGELNFHEVGTMGSHLTRGGRGNSSIQAVRLDDALDNLTFLKMDIEGGEARALMGAEKLISARAPRIAVTVYHYAHDILDIVANLRLINPAYRLRLRQHAFYYYDSVLYADRPH